MQRERRKAASEKREETGRTFSLFLEHMMVLCNSLRNEKFPTCPVKSEEEKQDSTSTCLILTLTTLTVQFLGILT